MMFRCLILCCLSLALSSTNSFAQVLPFQTDIYNISLAKLKNITKDSLKTRLNQLQQTSDKDLDIHLLLQKYLLEVSIGDQYLGLQQLENLSDRNSNNYEVLNTYAWALFIAEKFDNSLKTIDKAIAIHASQLGTADPVFKKMVNSAMGQLPAKNIISLKSNDYYDFLILQTIPANADSLLTQIHYLLYNRLVYLPHQDSITAQLILDAGDLIAKKSDRNTGLQYYAFALLNDTTFNQKVQERNEVIEEGKRSVKSTFNWASAIWAIPLVAMAVIGAAFLKSQKRNRVEEN